MDIKYQQLQKVFWWSVFVPILISAAAATLFMPWYYTLLIMAAFPLVVVLVMRPLVGTYLMVFLVPVTTASAYVAIHGKWNFIIGQKPIDLLPVFLPVLIFAFSGLILTKLAKLPQSQMRNPVTIPLVLFIAYSALTILWTDNTQHGAFQFLMLSANIMLFVLIITTVRKEASHKTLMWCWVLSIALQGIIAVAMFFLDPIILNYHATPGTNFILNIHIQGGLLQPSGWPRQPSGLQDFHETALFINIAIPIALGLFLTDSRGTRKLFLLTVIFFLLCVGIRTESRAGVGGMSLMALGSFFLIKRLRRFFALLAILFLSGVIFLALGLNTAFNSYAKTNFEMRLITLGKKAAESGNVVDPGMRSSDKHGRMNLWKKSFKKYIEVPIQGLGVGNLKYLSHAPHAHSIYFSVLFDFGLIGVGLALASLIIFVRRNLDVLKDVLKNQTSYIQVMSIAFVCGFLALGFHGLVDFDYNYPFFWLYAGMAVSTFNLAHEEYSATKGQVV